MSPDTLAREMTTLLEYAKQSADDAASLESLQEKIVAAIAERLPSYNWTGFYMLDPDDATMLVLGPFIGAPTPHVRIPISQGICGAAVASGQTIVVDDVNADPRYLSCSISTKSEIVVPVYASGRVVGEIDIDSHNPAAFGDADRVFLEEVARIVGGYIERHFEQV
ncbi:MAG TPA: GAF domain-containing protein [Bryobacteraceae bacterium]|jgi:L-methionine (R)-S-oxide reductase|nr:GAF domain-containing protein [Bryobacteraceae bacterium]